MGVHGLWQLLEPAGRPVDPHSLKGKVLAVDASIWLHQLVKGFRDKDGNPVANAHLLGVFFRVCKLLSYGIKPVFVFDGGVPILKRQTLASRHSRKIEALDKSEVSRQKLLSNYIRQQLQKETRRALPPKHPDLEELEELEALESNALPSLPGRKSNSTSPTKRIQNRFDEVDEELQKFREKFASSTEMDVDRVDQERFNRVEEDDSSEEDEWSRRYGMDYAENFSAITSKDFDVLPLETQHEILFEMQESRKMNNWAKMDSMPSNLQDFSSYQMDRLVKRRFLQKKIQSVQQEMGQRHIHVQNLDELLKMDYNFDSDDVVGSKEKGFVLVKKSPLKASRSRSTSLNEEPGSSKELEKGELNFDLTEHDSNDSDEEVSAQRKKIKCDINIIPSTSANIRQEYESHKSIPDLEEDEQIALAIQLSLSEHAGRGTDVRSPTKQFEVTAPQTDEREAVTDPLPPSAFVLPTSSTSCSKFLDTVGFSARIATSTSCPLAMGTSATKPADIFSDSDDDFEAVPDTEIMDEKLSEQKMVKGLLETANFQKESFSVSPSVVASINIAEVVSQASTEEDDIFANVFENNENSVETSPCNTHLEQPVKNLISSPTRTEDDDATNWDSDPDVELIESLELESTTSSDKSAFISKFVQPSSSSSVSAKAVNQHINRTLGRLPQQSITPVSDKVTMITAEYMQAQDKLNSEQTKLQAAKGFQERVATSISDQISVETQELLGLFGIPYIVSKMEAESQCAFLDVACLTDGTITDDSDAWLFGSLRVYKNFYSAGNKPIAFYQIADIIQQLGLDRDKLVLIAMLSGGDYSDGIPGVGPVTALEILAEFPTNEIVAFDSLLKFREWWDLVNDKDVKVPADLSKTREKLRKLKLNPGFPNEAVYQAYMNPSIDSSTEPFRWGSPDVEAIRAYVEKKFGWNQAKCDSMLLPVMKCQVDKSKQPTLDSFLVSSRYDLDKQNSKRKRGSNRLQTALKKLKQNVAVAEVPLSSESSSDDECTTILPSHSRTETMKSTTESDKEEEESIKLADLDNYALPRIPRNTRDDPIPQKVQHETDQATAKKKAIDIFRKSKLKKPK